MTNKVAKRLSANDVGTTGGHQAGILVPKEREILTFFPSFESGTKNPRMRLVVRELQDGTKWNFNFIYYNNRLFGGTRTEYRLTCMTKYLRAIGAKEGDELMFSKDENGSIFVERIRLAHDQAAVNEEGVLILKSGWKIINR